MWHYIPVLATWSWISPDTIHLLCGAVENSLLVLNKQKKYSRSWWLKITLQSPVHCWIRWYHKKRKQSLKIAQYSRLWSSLVLTLSSTTAPLLLALMDLLLLLAATQLWSKWKVIINLFTLIQYKLLACMQITFNLPFRFISSSSSYHTPTINNFSGICACKMECSWSDLLIWALQCVLHYQ